MQSRATPALVPQPSLLGHLPRDGQSHDRGGGGGAGFGGGLGVTRLVWCEEGGFGEGP